MIFCYKQRQVEEDGKRGENEERLGPGDVMTYFFELFTNTLIIRIHTHINLYICIQQYTHIYIQNKSTSP